MKYLYPQLYGQLKSKVAISELPGGHLYIGYMVIGYHAYSARSK